MNDLRKLREKYEQERTWDKESGQGVPGWRTFVARSHFD